LRDEVFAQDSSIISLQGKLSHLEARVESLSRDYKELIDKNQVIIDRLLEDKLHKDLPRAQADSKDTEPIRMKRPSWNKIRTDYELQQKKKFWENRIKEVEEKDKSGSGGEGSSTA